MTVHSHAEKPKPLLKDRNPVPGFSETTLQAFRTVNNTMKRQLRIGGELKISSVELKINSWN